MNKNVKMEKIIKNTEYLKNKYSYLLKPFIIIFIIHLFAIYPILRANFNYIDDLGRVVKGYREFYFFSRYVSEYLSILVHTSNYLTDISPLTQILAILMLSLSCIIVIKLFSNGKITLIKILSVIPMALSPYFLQCLSYKYDSIYMALSVFITIIPFIFYGKTKKRKIMFSLAILLGTLIMCTSYQASSGIIPIMTLFLAFKLWNDKETKESIYLLLISFSAYILGLLIFRLFIMSPVRSYISTYIVSIDKLIPTFFNNLIIYYKYVISDFRMIWKILIVACILCFIINNTRYTKQNKIISFILCLILIIISLFLAFGIYPALEETKHTPREMYGIGILVAIIGINAVKYKNVFFSKTIISILCYCFITFCFTYGNALSEQKNYIDFRVQSVINELNLLEVMKTDSVKYVYVTGSIGYAPSIENMPNEYKNMINRLIPQTFSGNPYMWDVYYFKEYFKIKNLKIADPTTSIIPENLEKVRDTMYFSIETNNTDFILLNLK